jgi:hypothetical protein
MANHAFWLRRIEMSDDDLVALVGQVQQILRRANYLNHTSLQSAFLAYDADRAGYISVMDLKRICHKVCIVMVP